MLPMDQVTRQRMSTGLGNTDRNVTDDINKQFQEWMGQNFNEGSEGNGDMNGFLRNLAVKGSKKWVHR